MIRKTLLAGAAVLPMLLAGCALPPLEASPEKPYVYDDSISHARNIANLFRLEHRYVADSNVAIETAPYAGITALDTALVASTVALDAHIGSHIPYLPGTSDWGKATAIGLGVGLAIALLTPSDEGFHNFVGFVPERLALTPDEARVWIVDTVAGAFEKAARDLYPDAEVQVLEDDSFILSQYGKRVVVLKESFGCKDKYDCKARIASQRPELVIENAGDLTPSERSWVFGKLTTQLLIDDKPGPEGRVDWTLVAMRTSVYLPEHIYVEISRHAGSRTPHFIAEKGRVNYYVLPSVQPTKPAAETAADAKAGAAAKKM